MKLRRLDLIYHVRSIVTINPILAQSASEGLSSSILKPLLALRAGKKEVLERRLSPTSTFMDLIVFAPFGRVKHDHRPRLGLSDRV